MPRKLYRVQLEDAQRQELLALTHKGTLSARKMKRAQILLQADAGRNDPEIMQALAVSRPCVERIRKRFATEGLAKALNEDPRPGKQRKLTGKQEARLIAEACSDAPVGHERWTLQLLAGRVVSWGYADGISPETVRQILKKTISSPGGRKSGVFPR